MANGNTRFALAGRALGAMGVMVACLSGCSPQDGGATGSTSGSAPRGPTWWTDVKPIVDVRCNSCHRAGGIAPFALDDPAFAALIKDSIRDEVVSRRMPPWPPEDTCNTYKHSRALTAVELDTLVRWVDAGAPEGDRNQEGPPSNATTGGLSRVDLTLEMETAYTPMVTPDEYRCFLLPWPEQEQTFLTGFRAVPGDATMVHHVIAFLVPPAMVEQARAKEAEDPLPGYACFGGPGLTMTGSGGQGTRAAWLGAWVPGTNGQDYPAGTGLRVPPGSLVVLQMHYNTRAAVPAPDLTRLELRTDPVVDKEAAVLLFTDPRWVNLGTMTIPAGEPEVEHAFSLDPSSYVPRITGGLLPEGAVRVYAMGLHMHELGKRTSLSVLRADGTQDCLLSIPDWDFHWQGSYPLQDTVVVQPGDQLEIRCAWDNSAAHQPMVGDVQRVPADVSWGEGTADEMCLGTLYVTQP